MRRRDADSHLRKSVSAAAGPGKIAYWHLAVVVLICFVTYSNSFSGQLVWDDEEQILHNERIRSFQNLPAIFASPFWDFAGGEFPSFYRPFQALFYMIAYHVGGTTTWPYHLINVLLHGLASVLVYLVCRELRLATVVGFIAAALFAAHPIHTEAVTWIAGLPDTGCGAFYLLALWTYLKYLHGAARTWLYLSALAFLCALFFKEMAITLPAAIFVFSTSERESSRANFKIGVAGLKVHLTAVVIYIAFRWAALGALLKSHSLPSASIFDWITIVPVLFAQYIRYALVPYPQAGYHLAVMKFQDRVGITLAYGAFAIAVCTSVWIVRRNAPDIVKWFVVFVVTLLPVFNFASISQTSLFAERYLYIPSFAAIMAVVAIFRRLPARAVVLSGAVLVLVSSASAYARNKDWANQEAFYESVLRVYPECLMVRLNLAEMLTLRGNFLKAQQHYERAIADGKSSIYFQAPRQNYRAFVGLATIAAQQKRYAAAKQSLEQALKLDSNDPGTYTTLGWIALEGDSNPQAAMSYLKRAVELGPVYPRAHDYLGIVLLRVGRYEEAEKSFRNALRINPANREIQLHLYQALLALGGVAARQEQYVKAKEYLQEALGLNPEDAAPYIYLGGIAMQFQGDLQSALSLLNKAVELAPQNEVAHDYLGSVLFNMGRVEEAAKQFQTALQINPNYNEARIHMNAATGALSK